MSRGTIGSFFTPDTFLRAGDASLPSLCPNRDVLLAQDMLLPQNGMHWPPPAPKPALCCSLQSLLPKFVTPGRSRGTVGTSGKTDRVIEGTETPGRCPQASRAACWDEDEDEAEALVLSWQCCCSSGTSLQPLVLPTLSLSEMWRFHQAMLRLLVLSRVWCN